MVPGLRETFRDFMNYTSIHGLGRFSAACYWIQKIFWLVVCLASFSVCGYQISKLAAQYMRVPLNTKIKIVHEKQNFPTVTFCDLNPLPYSEVKKWKPLFQTIEELSKFWSINMTQFENPDDANSGEIPNYTYTSPIDIDRFSDPHESMKTLFSLRMMALSDDQFFNMTPSFDDLVIDCTFHGDLCTERNFSVFRDDIYGICFMLNSSDTIAEVAGPSFGLDLTLNVRQAEYVPFISESAGVRLAITDQRHPPDLLNHGISVPTGFAVNIGLSTSERRRYEGTNECDIYNTYSSSTECVQLCQAFFFVLSCGCSYQSVSVGYDGVDNICDLQDLECVEREIRNFAYKDFCSSQCQVPCMETQYTPIMSMTRWPSGNFKSVVTVLANRSKKDYNKISNDLLHVNVYLHSLTKEVVEEEVAYTEENFISDIGGQLGLWAGISVLSLIEIIELFCLLINACVRKDRARENEDQDKNQTGIEMNQT